MPVIPTGSGRCAVTPSDTASGWPPCWIDTGRGCWRVACSATGSVASVRVPPVASLTVFTKTCPSLRTVPHPTTTTGCGRFGSMNIRDPGVRLCADAGWPESMAPM